MIMIKYTIMKFRLISKYFVIIIFISVIALHFIFRHAFSLRLNNLFRAKNNIARIGDENINKDCIRALKLLDQFKWFACLHLNAGGVVDHISYSNNSLPLNNVQSYYRDTEIKFLNDVCNNSKLNISGNIIFSISDDATLPYEIEANLRKLKIPLLSHSHNAPPHDQVIFQPDYHFIKSYGFREIIRKLDAIPVKHNLRHSRVFWRGSTTGQPHSDGCFAIPRIQASLQARKIPWLDVKISHAVQQCSESEKELRDSGVFGMNIPEPGWAANKGILDIPGNVNAYGLFWRLASGSVVYRVESGHMNAYIRKLIPWHHYIPIYANLSNFLNITKLVSVRNFRYIANNAKELTLNFTYNMEVERVARELNHLWSN